MPADLPRLTFDADVASRTAAVLSVTALAGAALLVARLTRAGRTGPAVAATVPVARDAYAYLVLGLATRFAIQQHRSRLQILVLLLVVTGIEAARRRPGATARRGATWLAGSAAVCLGVIMAKWALEPGALSDTLDQMRTGAAR